MRQSAWQLTLPVGGRAAQPEFLNGAVLVETSRDPPALLQLLQEVESRFGRERRERWGDRTLDLDLLLFGDAVIKTPALTVPHPRMSFRRFVLEPAVEIAGDMMHPTIGWTLARLLDQLDRGADCLALVASDASLRRDLATALRERFGMAEGHANTANDPLWPPAATTWLVVPGGEPSHDLPKLTILLDEPPASERDRGPTLRIDSANRENLRREAFAAIEAVWPCLGRPDDQRLQ